MSPARSRTVLEPRADNQRLFRHLEPAGYRTIKEFDFPHKRSRMVMADRHHFFTEVGSVMNHKDWDFVNRQLVAKMLAELEYEQVFHAGISGRWPLLH
ncbi:IucB [Klebsiella pneumoniae]|uniref:IucB n=1 Tax=Klebsiella pneumoniae TaxID=573 RepID=A0A377XKA5_KLEPN|nr:IucB [Klebsiella pneumoniae]